MASAITCAALWRTRNRPSGSAPPSRFLGVTMESEQSVVRSVERSRSSPFTFAPMAALARPAPIEAATSAAVTGAVKSLTVPSGSVIRGMGSKGYRI